MTAKLIFCCLIIIHTVIYVKSDDESTTSGIEFNEETSGETDLYEQLKRHPRETNAINFVRLLVMRLIYGFAQMFGFEEGLQDFANGALVPPGADDDDYGFDDDRDYSDDYY